MTVFDTIIRNANVLASEGLVQMDVALDEGRVAALVNPGAGESREVIDGSGLHLLPGAIDIHFHIRAPAFPHRGTVESETRAAAAGGITTLFEMPISKPCCNSAERVGIRRVHFAEHALIDFGLYGAPADLLPERMEAMKAAGVVALKIFTTSPPEGREDEFYGLSYPDEADQLKVLEAAGKVGLPVVVHAESAQLLAAAEQRARTLDLANPDTHPAARPAICESVAVAKLLAMNVQAGAKLHIAHVTSEKTVRVLRAFAGTSDFTAETCPHYLFRTHQDVARVGVFAKINPPVRDKSDQDALWQAIAEGIITHVTTDHAAFSYPEKLAASNDFLAAPPGSPGSEMLVPSMLHAVSEGRLSLEKASNLLSANAAARFGLLNKGRIAVGADGDLILVDLASTTEISSETLHTFARDVAHLYYGARFKGRVRRTIVRGRTVFDGSVVGAPGWGRFASPSVTPQSDKRPDRACNT
ncbi:dihydroorotase family protein [Hoeflea sp. 108]|uniref:dihydroorotase n=1 Tax=Hoeflea sp. 108 TaxID=1116369 RepID=UPI000373CE83|nr:dihydroorotase family protein [Hoeflea sp. 108]